MGRKEVLNAAAQLFREKGYAATSMQDIAEAVELQKASLYHHVENKQDILFSLLEQALDMLISDIRPVVDSDLLPQEKLRLAMQVYVGRLTIDADLTAVLLLEHRNLERKMRTRHNIRRDRFEALWRRIITEGVEAGVYRAIDVKTATFAILGVQNWMITWYRESGRLSALELADNFSDLFLSGLMVKKESEG